MQKTLSGAPTLNVANGTVTFTWKVQVGLVGRDENGNLLPQHNTDGTSNENYLLKRDNDYSAHGRDKLMTLTLDDALSSYYLSAPGTNIEPQTLTIQRDGASGSVDLKNVNPVTIWGTGAGVLEMVNKSIINADNNYDVLEVVTPVYTTYTVTAVYDVSDHMGDFYEEDPDTLKTTNDVDMAATLANLGNQTDDDSVEAEKKLDNKEPAHFYIEKTLNKAVGSPIPYDDSYGPITYTLKDSNGSPAKIYKFENNQYVELAPGEALQTGDTKVYYVLPGTYTMTETLDPAHTNDMRW